MRDPGVYEVEFGATLARAPRARRRRAPGTLKAVLLGGAAGGFVAPDELDIRSDVRGRARAGGYTLGSGVVMVFDETVDLRRRRPAHRAFFRDESCGQCVPCRVGTVRQEEALHRMASARTIGSAGDELALLDEIGQVMKDASICGLGQTAALAVQSAVSGLVCSTGGASA